MADIRLNLIADLGAFQGALASAVTQAKSTVAPVKISGEFDRQGWINAVRDAKAYLGKQLKTYKVTLEVDYDQSSLDRVDRKLKSVLDRNEKEVDYKVRLNFIAGDINTSLEKVREKFRTASPVKFQVEPYLTSNPEKGIQGLDAARKLIQDKVKGFGAAKFTVDVDTASIDSAANKLTNLKDSVDAVYKSFTDRTVGVSVDKTITGLQEAADALDRAFSNRTVQVGIDKTVQGLEDVGKALSAAFGNRTISLVVDETIRGLQEAKSVLASTFGDQLVNVVVSATDNVTAALEAIEAKIAAVAAAPLIRPSVDLSELVALNAELDKKQSHLSTVIKDFASSPIKPIVDTSNLDRLSKELDAIRTKIADAAKEVPVAPSVSASQGGATGGSSVAALKQLIQTSGRGETSMRRAGFDYVANALGVSPATIEKVRPQLLKSAEGIGNDTARGILVGLYEGSDNVEKGSELLGKKALQAVKSYLGIASPSKKAKEEVGIPFAQGSAVGIESATPVAEKAAQKLGQSIIDRLKSTIKSGLKQVRELLGSEFAQEPIQTANQEKISALKSAIGSDIVPRLKAAKIFAQDVSGQDPSSAGFAARQEFAQKTLKTAQAQLDQAQRRIRELRTESKPVVETQKTEKAAESLGKVVDQIVEIEKNIKPVVEQARQAATAARAAGIPTGFAYVQPPTPPRRTTGQVAPSIPAGTPTGFAYQQRQTLEAARVIRGVPLGAGGAGGVIDRPFNLPTFFEAAIKAAPQPSRAGGRLLALPPARNLPEGAQQVAAGISQAFDLVKQVEQRVARAAKIAKDLSTRSGAGGTGFNLQALGSIGVGAFGAPGTADLGRALSDAQKQFYSRVSTQRQTLRASGAEGLATLGIEQTGGIDQQKKALAQVSAAYRAGVVSASDYRRAQLQVKMATIDATLPMKGLTGSLKDLGSQFGEATKDILFYGAAYQALGRIQELPRNIYEAVKAQDSFSNSLKATLGAGDTYGQQIQFLTQLSNKYGMNIAETRDGFVKLFASMRQANIATGDVNKLQEATAVIGTAFKLTPDKMDRVTYALGQMASKGQITSEELKGQLGDVLPGAVSQFAAAAGYTGPDAIAKFSKAMEDGTFKGERMRQILVKWAENTTKDFAPAALQAANSIQGLENRLANATTKVYESFSGAIGNIMPTVITPLISGLTQVSDALDIVFANSQKRIDQVKKNRDQLLAAQRTGVAPETNLELGFSKGEKVKQADVATQLANTNAELSTLEGRLQNLANNQAAQKLATDFKNTATAVKDFLDGITSVLGPIGALFGAIGRASNSISAFGVSLSGLLGALTASTIALRVGTGILGVLGLNMIKMNGLTKAGAVLFNALAIATGRSSTALVGFQRAAVSGSFAARALAFSLNLIAKAGPLIIASGIFYALDKIGEHLDRNAKKARDFKDSLIGLGEAELRAGRTKTQTELRGVMGQFKNYPGGYAGFLRDSKEHRKILERVERGQASREEMLKGTQLGTQLGTVPGAAGLVDKVVDLNVQVDEYNNAIARQQREDARFRQQQQQALQGMPAPTGEDGGKGKGKGKGGGTPQAIGDDFVSLMQRIQSDTLKAALEEQRYAFEGAISRLFPRGAGIFQPFVDAYKGVFDFLNDFQERQMQQMESATKTMVSGFRLSERNQTNQARLTKNAVITQRNDPDAEKTGSDISIPGGVGAQIRNPFENMVIKSRGTQGGGSGATGRGYGNYITGEVVIGGKRYEVLLGHMDKINVNVGDVLGAGGLIGTQGISGRATGPHVTTHVNPLGGGSVADAQRVLGMIEGAWQKGQVIPSGVSAGTGLSATTLTAQQQAQIKEAEKALAEQQKRTTAAMLQGRMQDVFNLFEEANLGDKLSKVSVALRELQRRTEDFGFRAKEAFAEFLPEGAREARKAILSAQKDLADARRETEDIRLEFEQMAKQGGAIDQLFAGGIEALKDPQYKDVVSRINAMLAAAGKGTLEQAFIAAKGSATELRKILEGLGIDIEASAARLEAAALITEKLAIARAPFLEQDAALARQGSILGMMGISTGVIESQRKQLDIQKRLAEIRIQMQANPEEASAYQQEVVDLQRMLFLSQNIQGTFITIGELFGQLNDSFRGFFNDLGTGFAEAITNGTSMFDALTSAASNFFMAIGKYLVDLAAQQAAAGILGFIGNLFGFGSSFGSTSFGSFDLLGGAGGGFGSFAGSTTGSFGITPSLGGFNPGLALPGFANGGLVDAPTVALIGEGRYNEAVVPLPDGRSIPVQLNDPFSENREKLIQSTKEAASQGAFDVANELFSTNKSAMQRYGLAGSKPIQSNSSSANTTITNQSGGGISMSFNTTRIYNEEFVRVEDLQAALKATRQQSVNEATRTTFDRLRNSPGTRRSVGI